MIKAIKAYLVRLVEYAKSCYQSSSVIVMSTMEQTTWYNQARAFQAKLAKRQGLVWSIGAASIGSMLDFLIVAFIGVILLYQFTPLFEGEAATANISNSTTSQFGEIVSWLLPVLGFLGIIYLGVRFVRGKKGIG